MLENFSSSVFMRGAQCKQVQNCPKTKESLTGGNFKESGYFREEDVIMELILH